MPSALFTHRRLDVFPGGIGGQGGGSDEYGGDGGEGKAIKLHSKLVLTTGMIRGHLSLEDFCERYGISDKTRKKLEKDGYSNTRGLLQVTFEALLAAELARGEIYGIKGALEEFVEDCKMNPRQEGIGDSEGVGEQRSGSASDEGTGRTGPDARAILNISTSGGPGGAGGVGKETGGAGGDGGHNNLTQISGPRTVRVNIPGDISSTPLTLDGKSFSRLADRHEHRRQADHSRAVVPVLRRQSEYVAFNGPTASVAIARYMTIHNPGSDGLQGLTSVGYETSVCSCLAGTQVAILRAINDQLSSSAQTPKILWLFGVAGSGKSTIATSVAEHFRKRVGAFVSLSRKTADATDLARRVLHTIVQNLAASNLHIFEAVRAALDRDPGIVHKDIRTQFETLLYAPLTAAAPDISDPIIIILDGLDECLDHGSRQALISSILPDFLRLPPCFRFLITSRPNWDIVHSFENAPHPQIMKFPIDVYSDRRMEDVSSYIRHRLMQSSLSCTPEVLDSIIERLTNTADGLYIWAATACDSIQQACRSGRMLESVLTNRMHGLDSIYTEALKETGMWDGPNPPDATAVLSGIILAEAPLTDTALDALLCLKRGRSAVVLSRLGAVIQWTEGGIPRLHSSFRDYLLSRLRLSAPSSKPKNSWFIDNALGNQRLALGCLSVLSAQLCFNICRLKSSYILNSEVESLDVQIEAHVSPELAYAAKHWTKHLRAIGTQDINEKLRSASSKFLPSCFLYWLEISSLFGRISSVRMELDILKRFIPETHHQFITDAQCFVDEFGPVISQSVPHIYLSAVPFSAKQGLVGAHFEPKLRNALRWGKNTSVSSFQPSSGGNVSCLAFSPDASRMVSGSHDSIIQIWDTFTDMKAVTLLEHPNDVVSVAFGSDGTQITSGSSDGDAFLKHRGWVLSIAFSPDGSRIVSGSQDNNVRVWEGNKAASVLPMVHNGPVPSIAFARDGKIGSGSRDKTIRIWEARTGRPLCDPLVGHEGSVCFVAFSLDGRMVVSGAEDKTIRIWDATTDAPICVHSVGDNILSATFSPDGERIILGSRNRSIQICEVATGNPTSTSVHRSHDEGKCSTHHFSGYSERLFHIPLLPMLFNTSVSEADDTSTKSTSQPILAIMDKEGWVLDSNSKKMFWVPARVQKSYRNLSSMNGTMLDLSRFVHGADWMKCWDI
ncbi:WD40 repeat-like protein [Mycena sanguinolenta]|uniref:WD40 repeat-like protein n=1 Tax=Mycena sanguinolenta TaxID=230812 RepID=A0A8H6Y2L3_9AGAR|nr:WD40 repeat-like protein [Mycena sanguinolenta]